MDNSWHLLKESSILNSYIFLPLNMDQIYPTKNKLVKTKNIMLPLSTELYEELLKEYTKQLET